MVGDRIQITNRLTALLKQYFPQALEWAGPLDKLFACEFLARWPSLHDLQKATRPELHDFDRTHGARRSPPLADRFAEIQTAQPLTTDSAITQASILMVQTYLRGPIADASLLHRTLQPSHPGLVPATSDQNLFDCLPGAGEVLAPRLLVAFGSDRSRYQDACEIQRFTGIAPVIERSGKSYWVHSRLACPKFLRQTFHEFAAYSRFSSPWARSYYNQLRLRNVSHHAAVRALAFKWIRILYRCWKNRTPYDENVYTQALCRRGSPLAAALLLLPDKNAQP